jgi:hypothetical protein
LTAFACGGAPDVRLPFDQMSPMPDDDAIPRSVLAEQVKDRLLQDIFAGSLSASLAGSWQDPAPEAPRAAAPA